MSNQHQILKIRPDHLSRQAVIYIRQSTLLQVRENIGSTTRQYDLVKRAQELGWEQAGIEIIDQDQGQSGSSTIGRDGFQWLVAEVGLGHVGAILSLEVSRLARSCSDWYRLLEICALTDTLVIDEEGIYDPGAYNDRLLLGFHALRAFHFGAGCREPLRHPSLALSHAPLGWSPCRGTGVGSPLSWAGAGCVAQPALRWGLRLRTNPDPPPCRARRRTAHQGANAPGETG